MRFTNCDLLILCFSSPAACKSHRKFSTYTFLLPAVQKSQSVENCYVESNFLKESNAQELLDKMPVWDVVSITAAIGDAAREQRHDGALYLFSKMIMHNIRPTESSFGTVIPSSTALGNLCMGKQLHAFAMKLGVQSNVFVGSSLVDLYAKLSSSVDDARSAFEDTHEPNVVSFTALMCGYLKSGRFKEALELFKSMPERNVITWNAIICGFSQSGQNEEALSLFIQMLKEGLVLPDQGTFPRVIIAAANIAALGIGRSFHACALKFLGSNDVHVSSSTANSLISFYARCGSVEDSVLIFNRLLADQRSTIVSWNALACGYAQNGRATEAMELFKRMQMNGLQPNRVTILVLLWAYNHAGLVEEGLSYFNMVKLKYPADIIDSAHYACMVDLLSRSGRFGEAERFLHDLPVDPGIEFWKALLGGCQIHSKRELGDYATQRILALDPRDVSSYIMLSNAHSAAGRWQSMSMIRRTMREKGMKRVPGFSWIEIANQVHNFVTADRYHRQKDDIYMLLRVFFQHSTS
ncbi:hypothetical protein Dimus_007289 [Dionaea muscipula]